MDVPNIAGTFIKIILAKFPNIISAFFWVLGTLGARNGMWLLSLNYTYRGMKGTFQPCHPTLNGPLQGCQTGTGFPTPAKLKQYSRRNRHGTTPDPKCPVPLWITISPHHSQTLSCQLKKITRPYVVLPKGSAYHNLIFLYINHQNPMRITVQRFPSNSPFTGAYGKHNNCAMTMVV